MMGKRVIARACSVALVSTMALVAWAVPASAENHLLGTGAGIANFGTFTYSYFTDAFDNPATRVTISAVTMTGVVWFGSAKYVGSFRMGRMSGWAEDYCLTPTSCSQAPDVFYRFDSGPAELHGSNSGGDHVDGWCGGGGFVSGGLVGNFVERTCHARLNGGPVVVFGVEAETILPMGGGAPDGYFCTGALGVCGVTLDDLGLGGIFGEP